MSNRAGGRRIYRVNQETEKKVLAVARSLNYQPNANAKALRSGETHTIGVIVSDIANKFYAEIARCISEIASKNDYTVIFGSTDEKPEKLSELIEFFSAKGVDGYIIVPCENSQDAISALQTENKPFVLIDRDFSELGASSVILNNFAASRSLTSYLLDSGCRNVEMISYGTTLPNIADREKGFIQGMKDGGLKNPVVHHPAYADYNAIENIIRDGEARGVDGYLFATYRMTLLGRKAMKACGIKVPGNCRVACYMNSEHSVEFDTYERNICYVSQPVGQYAAKAMELLLRKIKGLEQNESKIVLQPLLSRINR